MTRHGWEWDWRKAQSKQGRWLLTQIDANGTIVHFVRHFEEVLKG